MQVFGGAVSTPIWGGWAGSGHREPKLVSQGSGQPTLFASLNSIAIRLLFSYNTYVTVRQANRQTDTTVCHTYDHKYDRLTKSKPMCGLEMAMAISPSSARAKYAICPYS